MPKDTGPRSFYFTAAGGSVAYRMHVGRIEMDVVGDAVAPIGTR